MDGVGPWGRHLQIVQVSTVLSTVMSSVLSEGGVFHFTGSNCERCLRCLKLWAARVSRDMSN